MYGTTYYSSNEMMMMPDHHYYTVVSSCKKQQLDDFAVRVNNRQLVAGIDGFIPHATGAGHTTYTLPLSSKQASKVVKHE